MKILFKLFTSTVLLFLSSFLCGQELIVADNATYLVTKAEEELQLQKLSLGNQSRIEFAPEVSHWYVDAMHAEIGDQVFIDARGRDGRDGSDGSSAELTDSGSCADGRAGSNGVNGENGGNGVDLRLRLGVFSLKSVSIDSSGGNGGQGGDGGAGQDMDERKCENSNGGNGGGGGNGGSGGEGGNVRISLWAAAKASTADIDSLFNRFTIKNQGGVAGVAGKGGVGGKAAAGKYINKKSLTGNKTWVPGGEEGADGQAGKSGAVGRDGLVEMEHDTFYSQPNYSQAGQLSAPSPSAVAPIESETNADLKAQLQQLQQQIQSLQRRLEVLEANADH